MHAHGPHMHGSTSSMKKAAFEVALKGKRQIAEGTIEFVFEKPQGFTFKAGQHLRMTLFNNPETDDEGDKRFLTLVSTPQDTDLVVAMRMSNSAFKRSLNRLPIGEKVRIEILLDVPHGAFALHADSSVPAVFIVSGIGIVPAYSMIKDALERKLAHKMLLIYSNRHPEVAPYLSELEDMARKNPSFSLVATMTEPEDSKTKWQGTIGLIDEAMLKKHVSDLQAPIYYLAGMPKVVDAMKALLDRLAVNSDKIRAEEWSGFKMGEHTNLALGLWKKHVLIVAVVLLVIIVGIVHAAAVSSLSNIFSLQNPIFYVLLAAMLIVIPFKFKHISRLLRGTKT
jgi:ferredoxin-NADP reductase